MNARLPMIAALAAVLVAAAMMTVVQEAQANSQIIPERLRHGNVYQRIVESERAHHARIGYVPNTTKHYVNMPVDHQDASKGTFKDVFMYDMTHWDGKAPCMMYLNGEGPLASTPGGYMADLAKNFSSCVLAIEHRGYGVSLPGKLTDKKLYTSTLNVDLAMQDVYFLIKYFEANVVNKTSLTWYLVGGSYSGAMAVWLNEKYPGFFKASWAASGVVRATFAFDEFDGHIKSVLSRDCGGTLLRIMRTASHKWDKSPADNARIRKIFNIPSSHTKTEFEAAMADAYSDIVKIGYKTEMCSRLLPLPEDNWPALEKYQQLVAFAFGPSFMSGCSYSAACMSNVSMSAQWASNGYGWTYQCCSHLAYWQTGFPGSIRSENITTSHFINTCRTIFYNDTFPDTWAFNKRYHGLHPQTQGYIVATQGSDDPWSTTGLKVSQGPLFPVNTAECTNCGHMGAMMSPRDTDPIELVNQRELVHSYLAQWLGIH